MQLSSELMTPHLGRLTQVTDHFPVSPCGWSETIEDNQVNDKLFPVSMAFASGHIIVRHGKSLESVRETTMDGDGATNASYY